jgi:membrane-bound serine protease (ClpP class)
VVVYVAPTGATAASAGCFITLAANVAAMAPSTTIGAAHPVSLGGFSGGDQSKQDPTMTQKLENFSVSYMEAIASRRNRNVEWAKSAVRESASITAERAQELKVIEIIARDLNDLLTQLNGRTIDGRTLHTSDAQVVPIKMSGTEQFFQMFWRPEVMFVLMLVAIYGLIGEMTTPGAILPGVIGAIALVLALYMSAILPVNLAGLVLIALAAALFVIDVFAPTHGVLTGGGIVAFLVGSLMLFDRRDPLFHLSLFYIVPSVIITGSFFLLIVGQGIRAQRLPVKVGPQTMLGKVVQALTPIDSTRGRVFVEGESWRARSAEPIKEGDTVQIIAIDGLTVQVIPKPTENVAC